MIDFEEERDTEASLDLSVRIKTVPPHAEHTDRPVWSRVNVALKNAFLYGGSLRLSSWDLAGYLAEELIMNSLRGKFRITLMSRSSVPKVGGYDLYEWWESDDGPFRGVIRFGDDDWDARTVCSDLVVAQTLFLEFFETGELLQGISSMRFA